MKEIIQKKLNRYDQIAKGVNKTVKPLAKASLALGGAFLAAIPVTEGAIVYSGVQNIAVPASPNFAFIDINGGGADMKFRFNAGPSNAFFYLQGDVSAAVGAVLGATNYANALTSNANINAAQPFIASSVLSMSYSGGGQWGALAATGTERYVGIRLSGNLYGWVRLRKDSGPAYTIVDWAYDDAAGTTIIPSTSLPVELTSFAAMVKDQTVILNWQTASEENNAGFEVQRSMDGENFETLTFIEGQGTTLEVQEYVYDDKALRQNQEYYYRLKQIDYDGQFDYSEIITARLESVAATVGNFYPNPTTNGVTKLDYTSNVATELTVTVYNVTGQILVAETRQVISGANNLELDFSNIAKGSYFVKLEAGDDKQYQKLIIE